MFRTLLKKEILQLGDFYLRRGRKGQQRHVFGSVMMGLLFFFIFQSLLVAFFGIASQLASVLVAPGAEKSPFEWLFFGLLGIMSLMIGVFGSIFNTYNQLFHAKDNEMLLAMPIPPAMILSVRMITVFIQALIYMSTVWLPAAAAYAFRKGSLAAIVTPLLIGPFLALIITAATCLLGFVVAYLSSRLPKKNAVVLVLYVVGFGLYFYACMNLSTFLENMLLMVDQMEGGVKSYAYPFYLLGQAACGSAGSFLLFALIAAAIFALCWILMAKGFLTLTTVNHGEKKKVYVEKTTSGRSMGQALFQRELKRFLSIPSYALNAGLGIPIMLVAAGYTVVKREYLSGMLAMIGAQPELAAVMQMLPLLLFAGFAAIVSMDAVTASSISLEAKTLWILRTLPVDTRDVLRAKERLGALLNGIPGAIASAVAAAMMGIDLQMVPLIAVSVFLYAFLVADLGLLLNLLLPNMTWTNEAVPVKQGLPVMICLFGGWLLAVLIPGGFWLLRKSISVNIYFVILLIVIAAVRNLVYAWLMKKGVERFENLQA